MSGASRANSPLGRPDAVVLGAGPAGSAAARLLSLWGHDVLVLSRPPARRALAESLPPSCTKLLDRIGVRAAVDGAGFLRATGNTVRWGGTEERVELFGSGELGYQVPRDRFDALLVREAVLAGARVIEGSAGRMRPAPDGSDCATVGFITTEEAGTLAARWILDCRGKSASRAPRASTRAKVGAPNENAGAGRQNGGLGRSSAAVGASPRTLALVGAWECSRWPVPDPTHTLVESYQGGWAWSVPETERRRLVTVMVDPAVTRLDGRGVARQYREQLACTWWIGPMAARAARMMGRAWACDATEHCSTEIARSGVLRVGDAASFVDPLSSFGVKKALASAWLAAVTVHTALADPAMASPAAAFYEVREREMYHALSRASAALAAPAGRNHQGGFWGARVRDAADDLEASGANTSTSSPGSEARARAALDELKARDRTRLRLGTGVTREARPVVAGNVIALRDHLVGGAFPSGVRYLRNVDVVVLADLARAHDQVGDLYGAYARTAASVPLPDFLGALASLIGSGVLTLD